jgi:iron(III) transport system ATP-binding protein
MITVRGLVKRFETKDAARNVVNDLAFEIPEGKLFTLLGPSGCGKTTTLRMIAGLERPTSGEILLDGKVVYSSAKKVFVPANRRPIGMVFQSYAIWPHMTVFENVAFPLTVQGGLDRGQIRKKTMEALDLVGLSETANRSATALSGGQQQRVALARALVREPRVLLLDEPLSNLDAQLRERMRGEIREVQQKLGITAVYVTHDQSEALAISDLVMLMDQGNIVEMGQPQQIYRFPKAEFTANFIGVANALAGVVEGRGPDGGPLIRTAQGTIACSPEQTGAAGDHVRVFLRPENFALSRKRHSDAAWTGTVRFSIYQGDAWDYHVDVGGEQLRIRVHQEKVGLSRGDVVYLEPDGSAAVVMKVDADGAIAAPASLHERSIQNEASVPAAG